LHWISRIETDHVIVFYIYNKVIIYQRELLAIYIIDTYKTININYKLKCLANLKKHIERYLGIVYEIPT